MYKNQFQSKVNILKVHIQSEIQEWYTGPIFAKNRLSRYKILGYNHSKVLYIILRFKSSVYNYFKTIHLSIKLLLYDKFE